MAKLKLTKGDVKMKKIMFFVLLFTLIPSICFGAEYAVDEGSHMFGITAGLIKASGNLYEDEEGNSSTTILIMPSWARFFVPLFSSIHDKQRISRAETTPRIK